MKEVMQNHKSAIKGILKFFALSVWTGTIAQQQQQPQKTPVEIAAEQADRLQRDLKLDNYQVFVVDSTLQTNLAGVMNEFEQMKKGGMQNPESYREVQKLWQKKTDDTFERIMTLEQFDRYLRISGMSNKERKKKLEEVKKRKESK
ncbi:hypothetical protein SDC9_81158 [bioreactor metagenome]|uniref:DUF4168 domain-containing protein n=1 Tax=bioreactor metagenome TaxID=1076179 RepID=A0A644Z1G2_9ZZZZ